MGVLVLRNLWQEEEGQDLVEYALLMTSLSLIALGILISIGTSVTTFWHDIMNGITTATTAAS